MEDLRIGTAILKEFIDLENEKAERAAKAKVDPKAVAEAVANQVKLAFMDDRKTKMLHDEREKERRAARAAALARQAELQASAPTTRDSSTPSPTRNMPGSGHTLSNDGPPPYEPSTDSD